MRFLGFLTLLLLLIWVPHLQAGSYGFKIRSVALVRQGDNIQLKANIHYKLSDKAIDALQHGVTLKLEARFMLLQQRKFFWDKTVVDRRIPFRLRYHALAQRFQVINDTNHEYRNYSTLEKALVALGQVSEVSVFKAKKLKPDGQYEARLKVALDIEALPLPLRPIAYVSPQWYLSSPWYKWHLDK